MFITQSDTIRVRGADFSIAELRDSTQEEIRHDRETKVVWYDRVAKKSRGQLATTSVSRK